MKIKKVPTQLVKGKLIEAYNSTPETPQIDLFNTSPGPESLAQQNRILFNCALQLIEQGHSPSFIYATINTLSRERLIILHPFYHISSIDQFWNIIDKLRDRCL